MQTDHLIPARRSDLEIVKKKRESADKDFAVLVNHRVKLKISEKRDKNLHLARELKKSIEHEGDCDINCNSCCHSNSSCPVGWGCRIHRLLLCRGVRPPPNECPGYDTKQSDGEVLAMLELWGMRNTPSLPSLPGPLCSEVVAPDKGPIYGLIRTKPYFFHYMIFAFKLRIYAKMNCLKWNWFDIGTAY